MTIDLSEVLIPRPWSVEPGAAFDLTPGSTIEISVSAAPIFHACLDCCHPRLPEDFSIVTEDAAGHWLTCGEPDMPEVSSEPGSYRLMVDQKGLVLAAWTAEGFGNGANTLLQMMRAYGSSLPGVDIQDSPAAEDRGVNVPASASCCEGSMLKLVRACASYRITQIAVTEPPVSEAVESAAERHRVGIVEGAGGSLLASDWIAMPGVALLEIAAAACRGWEGSDPDGSSWTAFAVQQFGLTDPEAAGLLAKLFDLLKTPPDQQSAQFVLPSDRSAAAFPPGIARKLEPLSSKVTRSADVFDCLVIAALISEHFVSTAQAAGRILELLRESIHQGHSEASTSMEAAAHVARTQYEDRKALWKLLESNWQLHHDGCPPPCEAGASGSCVYWLMGSQEAQDHLAALASQLDSLAASPDVGEAEALLLRLTTGT